MTSEHYWIKNADGRYDHEPTFTELKKRSEWHICEWRGRTIWAGYKTVYYVASSGDQFADDYDARQTLYLHPTGHVHGFCGEEGFYKTQEQAQKMMEYLNNLTGDKMKLPENKKYVLEKGTRVKYVSGKYSDQLFNPLWGGKYGCIPGTVQRKYVSPDHRYSERDECCISVKWDNGEQNSYGFLDLEELYPYGKILEDDLFEI